MSRDARRAIPIYTSDAVVRTRPLAALILFGRLPLVRLGALRLLCGRRLALHLPLRILRRSCDVVACLVHPVGRWVFLGVGRHAGCRLTAADRCWSGTSVLQVCGSVVAGACHRSADAQNYDGATREN